MNDFLKTIADAQRATNRLYSEKGLLAAIWLKSPLRTANETTVRLEAGQLVKVANGELVDCERGESPTHKILECWGTLVNQFEVVLESLENQETITIKL